MRPQEAIEKLSQALALLNDTPINKEAVRTLTHGLCDAKHEALIERGLIENNRALILHGIMGTLSHYETEKETTQSSYAARA